MPAVLTEKYVCSTKVPRTWEPIVADLSAFMQLELDVCKGKPKRPSKADRERLTELHDALVTNSARLLEPAALDDQTPTADVEIFARAVLVLMKLNECVAADQPEVLDTAGSRTLRDFEADFRETPEGRRSMLKALKSFPELSEEMLDHVQQQVQIDAQDAERKLSVVKAIRDEFDLWPAADNLRDNIQRFFSACYPDTGITADEIELIVTGCMIFFCLPFSGTELRTERFQQAGADQQEPVRRFLQRAAKFAQWQFAHFPVFGFLRGEELPQDLVQRLARRAGLSVETVCYEISRLTAIVPLQDVDKYVVHDVWGHGWQASMLRFDELYAQISHYAKPLTLDEQTRGLAGEKLRLGDCFRGRGDQLQLNEGRFREFVQYEIMERLPVAMTPVLAEVIADIAEFKFVELQPDKAESLLSSSLLKQFPSKLDLIMQDVPYYFRQATKVFSPLGQLAETAANDDRAA